MKRVLWTIAGGRPRHQNDFRFERDGIKEGLEAPLARLNPAGITNTHGYILWGCAVTEDSGELSIAEGLVAIGGELLTVAPQSVVMPEGLVVYALQLETYYDPEGYKQYEDASYHNTYEVRRAQLVAIECADGSALLTAIGANMTVAVDSNLEIWKNIDIHDKLHGFPTQSGGTAEWGQQTGHFTFWKNSNNQVTVNAAYLITDVLDIPEPGQKMYNLPSGYRPAAGKEPRVPWTVVGGDMIYMAIKSNGDVLLEKADGTDVQGENGGATCTFYAAP